MSADAPTSVSRCPRCGGTREAAVGEGMCPRCLFACALELDPAAEETTATAEDGIRSIGGYRLLGEIARGGAGIVYRAWQPQLKREVALKMLLSARLENPQALDRFRREAELMASLDHPGILPVYEVGAHAGVPWFSMKLAERGSLAERIPLLRGRFEDIARLLAQVARGVGHAHRRGVLHRDLKPSNIVFDREGQPLVTDFGLARRLDVDSSLTGVDALIGTPRYIAPEVITTPGAELTAAVDVYGLGAILYELLTGAPPFAELTPLHVLHRLDNLHPRRPRRSDATIPAELETICLRCLEKRPVDRYASADALADALQTWLYSAKQNIFFERLRRLKDALPSRRRRAGVAAALSLVVVLMTLGTWYTLREPLPLADPAVATRTVAILPLALRKATIAEKESARQLAAHVHLPLTLPLLPFESALGLATSGDFPTSDLGAADVLGAFIFVDVVALPNSQDFALRARDVLRNERLYETTFALADVDNVARNLVAALVRQRQQPTPEARLTRAALASFLRADRLPDISSEKNNAAAIAAIKDAITQAPDSALAHAKLAYLYGRHGGDAFWGDSAIEEAARAQRMDPRLGAAANQLGHAFYFKTWFSRAAKEYEQARSLGNLSATYWLGLLYYGQGRFDESYSLFSEDLRFNPDDKWTEILMAHLLFTVGENDAGERVMRMAIAQEPQRELRTMKEAEIALYRRDSARCREIAGSLKPETRDDFYSASEIIRVCSVQQGDFAAALATVNATKRAYASDVGAANSNNPARHEAILLAQLHRPDEIPLLLTAARQGLQAAIDGHEEDPSVWWRMAAVQRVAGEVDAAYATLEHAFALGLTVNNRNRSDLEFLPFLDDARFQVLRAKSEAYVAAQREKVVAQLDTAMREPVATSDSPDSPAPQASTPFGNPR